MPPVAEAHGRSVSYSNWTLLPGGAEISLRLKLLEISRMGPEALPPGTLRAPQNDRDIPALLFPDQLVLQADGLLCRPEGAARRVPDQEGWAQYRWRVICPENPAELVIESRLLLDVAPSHMHFARVRTEARSENIREKVLTEAAPTFKVRKAGGDAANTDADVGSGFVDYVLLGIEHILSGWDHLAFVLGLLLLARGAGEVARLITGFTLAHSLTLALAVLGWVHPQAAAVEAVIAFSVALVAAEKGWMLAGRDRSVPTALLCGLALLGFFALRGTGLLAPLTAAGLMLFTACYFALAAASPSPWLRVCLTFAFGLVHGFGFAGILTEMTLPSERLVPALLGFNVGVELGQLGVVALLWPLLLGAQKLLSSAAHRRVTEMAAAGLCGLGLYWFALRAFGAA